MGRFKEGHEGASAAPFAPPFGEVISMMTTIYYEIKFRRIKPNNNLILYKKAGFLGENPLKYSDFESEILSHLFYLIS